MSILKKQVHRHRHLHINLNNIIINILELIITINLFKIKLPMSAISSITHRLAGIYIFFITLPLSLYLLYFSTRSYNDFVNLKETLNNSVIISTFVTFSLLVFIYHVLTGVRPLLQDIHIGESLLASKLSSYIVFILWFSLVFLVIFNFITS